MNENLNLVYILKDCPIGTKLYSTVFGEVEFDRIDTILSHPIVVRIGRIEDDHTETFAADGRLYSYHNGECVLFPSRDQHDWSKFSAPWYNKNEKFNPKTLQPFDKIIARIDKYGFWCCELFSFIEEDTNLIKGCGAYYKYCVPYNNDTKHLIGTAADAPGYYKYWED